MKPKSVKIGSAVAENNVFLAPLAGYTDFAFRSICAGYGAGLAFTEMVSANGLLYNSKATKELLYTAPDEKIKGVQLFGSDAALMKEAVLREELAPFDVIDVNMGCPVPKIYGNGAGSALLNDLPKAEKILTAMCSTGRNVTVKIRLGAERGKSVAVEFAKMAEGAGVKLITVHGRYRPDYYAGEVHFDEIARVKNAVNVPVIANGGIFSRADAETMMEKTGADGVMVARGALAKPYLFSEILEREYAFDLYTVVSRQLELLQTRFEDRRIAVNFRKVMPQYLKGVAGEKEWKRAFTQVSSCEEILALLKGRKA
ncbi:MAG: tRNA-dihydrouridine synthase [Bacillota bacterium]|nr:MAG: tRNA-dihydrouridine synthase [Bacillota bacterium]